MITPKENTVESQSIKLPKTYSPEQAKLDDMIESIKIHGILHPPIIREDYTIIAGKLRVKAAQKIDLKIKVLVYPNDLTEDEYLEISLHENLKRGNLSWDEIVLKEKELHELRQRQRGVQESTRGKKSNWGIRDTAKELDIALGKLSEDLQLADAIINDPSLRRVKDKQTARKVIDQSIKRNRQECGAGLPIGVQAETNIIHCGDSGIILKSYPDNTFDACITDPPWLEFKDPGLTRDEFTLPVFKEVYRVLKNNSFLYAFVSTQDWDFYSSELPKLGFWVQKYPLIWAKEKSLSHGGRSWEYQRDYEPLILAVKGQPALTSGFISAIFHFPIVPSVNLIHPNEKPVDLIKSILSHCTYDTALVLDPFCGSGVVPLACKATNRSYVGIEREEKFCAKIKERLK